MRKSKKNTIYKKVRLKHYTKMNTKTNAENEYVTKTNVFF